MALANCNKILFQDPNSEPGEYHFLLQPFTLKLSLDLDLSHLPSQLFPSSYPTYVLLFVVLYTTLNKAGKAFLDACVSHRNLFYLFPIHLLANAVYGAVHQHVPLLFIVLSSLLLLSFLFFTA